MSKSGIRRDVYPGSRLVPQHGVERIGTSQRGEAVSVRVPTVASPYLTSKEAVEYLKLPSLSALYTLIREHALPAHHRGRLRLFDVRELDAWVRGLDPLEYARQRRKNRDLTVGMGERR